jgi:hypothetical protein
VCVKNPGERLSAHYGRIARNNQRVWGAIADRLAGNCQRVAGTQLRLLEHEFRTQRVGHSADILGLISCDNKDCLRTERKAGANYVLDQRAPASVVQYFRQARAQAGALARGEDNDNEVLRSHSSAIVAFWRRFDNSPGIATAGQQGVGFQGGRGFTGGGGDRRQSVSVRDV